MTSRSETNSSKSCLHFEEIHGVFDRYKGDDVDPDVDLNEYSREIHSTLSKRDKVKEHLKRFQNAMDEANDALCVSMAMVKVLTLMGTDIDRSSEHVLIFIPTDDGGIDKPNLVAFFGPRDLADKITEDNTGGKKFAIPSVHEIVAVVEMKAKTDPVEQCQRYLFSVSWKWPSSRRQYGLVVREDFYQLLALNLDNQMTWERVAFNDPTCINQLYSCVKLIRDEALRKLHEATPVLVKTQEIQGAVFAFYNATVCGRLFHLLPIFSGGGDRRKPFAALAVAEGNPNDTRVFKYSWEPNDRRGRERSILQKIQKTPGVVQIDDDLSNDSLEKDGEGGRELSLLVLKTIGRPLSSCSSVQEFLEAMYDLLEVLRYLVQEKKILHRDISWGNVLLNPSPAPEVEIRPDPTKEPINHKYRFISNIFGEKRLRIRVALTDFDHALDLSGDQNDLRDATGTPMFMSNDVLEPSAGYSRPLEALLLRCSRAANEDYELKKYWDSEEKEEWDKFYTSLDEIKWELNENPRDTFRHGAVHDAESVFWLCFLFFNRIRRKHLPVDSTDELVRSMGIKRGKTFRDLASKEVGGEGEAGRTAYKSQQLPANGFDEQFRDMLNAINNYLYISWKDVESTQHGERYEFHLHDFMQRLILKELHKLRGGDGIPIEEKPLPVFVEDWYGCSYARSSQAVVSGLGSRSESGTENVKSDVSVPSAQEGFPPLFWDILGEKSREKLWLVADRFAYADIWDFVFLSNEGSAG